MYETQTKETILKGDKNSPGRGHLTCQRQEHIYSSLVLSFSVFIHRHPRPCATLTVSTPAIAALLLPTHASWPACTRGVGCTPVHWGRAERGRDR